MEIKDIKQEKVDKVRKVQKEKVEKEEKAEKINELKKDVKAVIKEKKKADDPKEVAATAGGGNDLGDFVNEMNDLEQFTPDASPLPDQQIEGDFIGIRQKMFLSHSYDHRVVNGSLGGQFLKTVKDYLEAWDDKRTL